MRRIFSILVLLCALMTANAQTQQVHIKTRGRLNADGTVQKGNDIPNATLSLGNGSSHVSDGRGALSFNVGDNKTYVIKDIRKNNYQICDRDILEMPRTLSKDVFEIAMQTPDEALEDRLESEEKIRATLTAELNKQKAELRRLKEEQRITQQEYNEKLKALYDAQGTNEKFISEMAERYSTMDFDQMDEFQSRVAFYIRNGELALADSLLNTKGSMMERSAELDRMDAAIKADSEDIAQRQIAHNAAVEHKAKKLEDFAADCYSHYEMCKLQHKNDSAAFWLELRASKDSLNIGWQLEVGLFLSDYLADYERALMFYQFALTNALNSNSEEQVAKCYNNIGSIYSSQGDYARSLEYHTKALDIQKKVYGEKHPDVATSYNNIGYTHSSLGEYASALEYYTKALDIQKKVYGEEHPDVARNYNNIGETYSSLGEYARALEYLTKALDIQKKVYGEEHPDVARSYNNIGYTHSSLGEYASALEYYTKALGIKEKVYGEEHPDVARNYNNIGETYSSLGEYARALEYLTKALDIQKKVYGEEHPDIARSYNNIGEMYSSLGEYARALEYLTRALDIQKKVYGEGHPDVARSYNNIGHIHSSLGEYARALEYLTKALDIQKKVYGEEHPDVARSYNNIGHIHSSLGEYARALEYLTRALDIQKKVYGEEHPDVATSYNNIGYIYNIQGDCVRALDYHTKALDILKNIFSEEHPNVAASYNNIGLIYYSRGEYAQSLVYFSKALDILKNIFGEEHPNVATIYNNIGDTYSFQGDYAHTLEYLIKSLTIKKKVLGDENPEVANTFIRVHEIYDKFENNKVNVLELKETISIMAYTLTCIEGNTPAWKQGMSGEYIVLKFEDWTIQGKMSLINKNNEFRGKPKTIVVMKDGVISEHFFENAIGAKISCKYVGREEKQRIIEAYEKWAAKK